jgi:cytidyltransferase-like protein
MIHGRFQPFHIGHLEYLRAAMKSCDGIVVGITNADSSTIIQDQLSPHRHLPRNNPFGYFDRFRMVAAVLEQEGRAFSDSLIIPFPIHSEHLWSNYAPTYIRQYVTVFGDWEAAKAERLRMAGYQVEVFTLPRLTSGTEIRARIRHNESWKHLVPDPIVEIIESAMYNI